MAKQILPESPSGIYEIWNTKTDKRYVGSAQNIKQRWREHLAMLTKGTHHSRHLQSSWDKHGKEVFVFQPVLYCPPEELIEYEQLCIDELNSAYNICRTAGSTRGTVKSIECRQKISAKAKGRTWSEEARARVSATLTGRKLSAAHAAKLIGNQHAKGSKHTDEWKANNSVRMTGVKRPKDEAYRKKISDSLKGRKLSPEQKAAISKGMTGLKRGPYKPMSEETKAAALEKRRANPPKRKPRVYTEEQRKRLSDAAKLSKRTPEGQAKISAAMKSYWADPEYKARVLASRAETKRRKTELAT